MLIRKSVLKKSMKGLCKGILCSFIALFLTVPTGAAFINFQSMFSPTLSSSSIYLMGATIIVDDDGTGDYTSIQDAIDNAFPGDVISVKNGNYPDPLTVPIGNLTISAASGEYPTLYVDVYDVGIDVSAADVILDGFEIFGNGSRVGGPYPTIRASPGADRLIVKNNRFKVLAGVGQMALMLSAGVVDVSFLNNVAQNYATSLYHAAYLTRTATYYGSIQDALDVSLTGDSISVFPGTYDEQLVIDRRVTLDGYGPSSLLQPSTSPTAGVYDVAINANSTIVKEFAFDFNGPTNIRSGNGIVVSDLSMPPVRNVKIQNNIIYTGDANTGIQTGKYSDVSGLVISGNMFYGDADGMGEGVYVNPYTGTGRVTIDDNRFYGYLYAGISIEAQNVTASGNVIDSNVTKGISGIRFIDITGGQVFSGVSILGNAITNMTYGVRVGTSTDVGSELRADIQSNAIIGNDVGIWVLYGANLSDSVYNNSLADNTFFGINNIGSSLIDAVDNWWGHISGPYHPGANPSGTGVNVSNNVVFWPWYEFASYSIPPVVTYTVGPPQANGGALITDLSEIEMHASDAQSGLLSFQYRTWDALTHWSAWMDYAGDITFSGDGLKKVQYNATDKAGTRTEGTRLHILDTTAPTVTVLYPNGGEYLRGSIAILWEAADKIPDQQQEERIYYAPVSSFFPGHVQSFQPTESDLDSIQLLLYGDDAIITVTVYSTITPVPVAIANSSVHLQNIGGGINSPVWIDFPFDTNVTLDINATYYLGVRQERLGPVGFYWYYYDATGVSDAYLYGQGWLNDTGGLVAHPEWDWCFRTMYWVEDIDITLEYSPTGVSPWSTIKLNEQNDGTYLWDTTRYPEGKNYRIRIIATDDIGHMSADISDTKFMIDNTGPYISNIMIKDITLDTTEYTKDEDMVEITANIGGNPVSISADLSGFGKGTSVVPTSFTGTTAKWLVSSIHCTPANGTVTVRVMATDPTGDESGNVGTIIADNAIPTIRILRPNPGVYFLDRALPLHYSFPFVIGPITFRVEALDSSSGIRTVEFYIQNVLKESTSVAPYEFFWDEGVVGNYIVEVVTYDNVGHRNSVLLHDFFILNFDVLG